MRAVYLAWLLIAAGLVALSLSTATVAAARCRLGCPRIYYPVCGYKRSKGEYRNFGNRCEFDAENCLHPSDRYQQYGSEGDPCPGDEDLWN